ncbi:hypothetical protein HCH_06657 [Hahella chejuensis KCTC 2396]|uniref:Uncharacterized protein n=1 Tax=Hahella chejuensis (strain KCTC 2396) TaxID=349521 RepID=Q2S7T4_HAHCH|nr:hypothetical protein HCH_06657 [Hahella chejuensis KCTC 2396]
MDPSSNIALFCGILADSPQRSSPARSQRFAINAE